MVQIIGVMIGCYIIVRMFSLVLRGGDRKEATFVRVISAINIVITFFLMVELLLGTAK